MNAFQIAIDGQIAQINYIKDEQSYKNLANEQRQNSTVIETNDPRSKS